MLKLKEWIDNNNLQYSELSYNPQALSILSQNLDKIKYEKLVEGSFVHVRLGDISNDATRCCEIQYYEKALEGLNGGYISSDSPNHEIVKRLSNKFNLEVFQNSAENTLIFGSQFENKILSLGTFSWWIGFLGNQNNVICPSQKEYMEWHGDIFPFLNWKEVSIK